MVTMSSIDANLGGNCAKPTRIHCGLLVLYARLILLLTLTNLGSLVIYLSLKLSLVACLQIAMFSGGLYELYVSLRALGQPLCANFKLPTDQLHQQFLP